jgi:UDP-N-acetylenolpyruvoylglucosamine reductase
LLKYPQIKGNKIQEVDSVEHHDTHNLPSVKLSAGQLIELAGYKGKSVGNVATYEKHALVIVNNGGASGIEIRAFAQSIQKRVIELF